MKKCNATLSCSDSAATSSAKPRSWTKASDAELIAQAQMLFRESGRSPTVVDFNRDGRTASATAAINRFGGWNNFLEKAGLHHRKGRPKKYSRKELIRQVQMLADGTGAAPSMVEFDKHPETANTRTVIQAFGSWSNCVKASGLVCKRRFSPKKYTDADLIAQVRKLTKRLGRNPILKDFDDNPDMASSSTILNHFGSWCGFLEAAGLNVSYGRRKKYTKEALVDQILTLADEKNGVAPTMEEFNSDQRTASTKTAIRAFGSWSNFLEVAGLRKHN